MVSLIWRNHITLKTEIPFLSNGLIGNKHRKLYVGIVSMEDANSRFPKTVLVIVAVLIAVFVGHYVLHGQPNIPPRYASFWKDEASHIGYDDLESPPLTHVSSGLKCVSLVGEPSFVGVLDLLERTDYQCQWGWYYKVTNNLTEPVRVTVTYMLKDKDDFIVTESRGSLLVGPGETETLQQVSSKNFDLSELERVRYASWRISHTEISQ